MNVFYWWTIDYFARPAERMPLLPRGSLAVRLQFYRRAPFVMLGLYKRCRLPGSAVAAAALAAIVLA